MAEHTRKIEVVIERDTNKATYKETLNPYEYESLEEFVERVKEKLDEMLLDNN